MNRETKSKLNFFFSPWSPLVSFIHFLSHSVRGLLLTPKLSTDRY